MIISFNIDLDHSAHKGFFSWYNKITLNGKKNSCRDLFWWKKILANSDAEKKKFILGRYCPSSSTTEVHERQTGNWINSLSIKW